MINVDTSAANRFVQANMHWDKAFNKSGIGRAVEWSASNLVANEFDLWSDAHNQQIPHVYEWGFEGKPGGRLWRYAVSRETVGEQMYVVWLPSHVEVPRRTIETVNMPDTRRSDHIFIWKAPIMESGQSVTIRRKAGTKVLAFVVDKKGTPKMAFSRGPMREVPGYEVKGNFTSLWNTYMAGRAQDVVDDQVANPVSQVFVKEIRTVSEKAASSSHATNLAYSASKRVVKFTRGLVNKRGRIFRG